MSERLTPLAQAVAAVKAHAHGAKLALVAAEVATKMAATSSRHAASEDVELAAQHHGLERASAQTDFGNVLSILERGAEDPAERAIVSAFVAGGALKEVAVLPSSATVWAERLCTLGAHAGFSPLAVLTSADALSLDRVLSEVDAGDEGAMGSASTASEGEAGAVGPVSVRAADAITAILRALVDLARTMDQGRLPNAGRAELLIAVAALAESLEVQPLGGTLAQAISRLSADLSDPVAARLITARAADAPSTVVQTGPSSAALQGQLGAAPRSGWVTVLMAMTGWALVRSLGVLAGEHILGLERGVRVELTEEGLHLRGRIALMGRQLHDYNTVYPLQSLVLLTRDVRFPRLPLYAGLIALLFGAYLGTTFLVWGIQGSSLRLVGYGLLTLLIGVGLDFALTTLLPGVRGEVRLVVVPRRGPQLCVAGIDREDADRLLADVAGRLRSGA